MMSERHPAADLLARRGRVGEGEGEASLDAEPTPGRRRGTSPGHCRNPAPPPLGKKKERLPRPRGAQFSPNAKAPD